MASPATRSVDTFAGRDPDARMYVDQVDEAWHRGGYAGHRSKASQQRIARIDIAAGIEAVHRLYNTDPRAPSPATEINRGKRVQLTQPADLGRSFEKP